MCDFWLVSLEFMRALSLITLGLVNKKGTKEITVPEEVATWYYIYTTSLPSSKNNYLSDNYSGKSFASIFPMLRIHRH